MRILVTSTQYPYYGGAATNSYALVKYFRRHGEQVAGLFFDKHTQGIDPDKIGGIWRAHDSKSKRIIKRMIVRYLGGTPDIILAKNYAAPVHSKEMFPNSKVVYMVTGSPHMIQLSKEKISAKNYLNSKRRDIFTPEIRAIKISDLVVPNSPIGKQLLYKHYGRMTKITDPIDTSMALNSYGSTVPFNKRRYDIAFIASNLKRDVKNSNLAATIFSKFYNLNKVVIGNNNEQFRKINKTKIHNLLPHNQVISILEDTKLVICTSFYDASPNTIKEAITCQSNVLISKNCGWSESYPEEFVCEDVYDLREWINKATVLFNNNIPCDLDSLEKEAALINKIRGL